MKYVKLFMRSIKNLKKIFNKPSSKIFLERQFYQRNLSAKLRGVGSYIFVNCNFMLNKRYLKLYNKI